MSYLSLEEYNRFDEFQNINMNDEQLFRGYLAKASSILDSITRRFYVFNELETDFAWRRDEFKRAIACQINYFIETGHTTTEGLNSEPQSMSIGRVSMTKTSRFNPRGENEQKPILCPDVYLYLEGTGLLNRGVR